MEAGVVYLVGGGPGDPGLLTCRGKACLEQAEVVVFDGLVSVELLGHVPEGCEQIYAGKKQSALGTALSQEEINRLLVSRAKAGKRVVRLKGGDPFVFGRGAEECIALRDADIRFEVVPGVSAATAVAAYAGIPLSARGTASTAALVTGYEAEGKQASAIDWKSLAGLDTLVLFMAWKELSSCVEKLIAAGRAGDTPAAAVRWGTTASQKSVYSTLAELPTKIDELGLRPPVLIVIGQVVALHEKLSWYENRPLFGKRILLTRSADRAEDITNALRDLGADPLVAPLTQIASLSGAEHDSLSEALLRADDWDWLLLTSANAVHACCRALDQAGLDVRSLAGVKLAAVGNATSQALASHGLRADLIGRRGDGQGLAETLLAEAGAARVLFPRAARGRDEAVEVLRRAGATVTVQTAYRTVPAARTAPAIVEALGCLGKAELQGAVFFAPSQVEALFALDAKAAENLAAVKVVAAIGKTTAAALEKHGVEVHAVPDKPTTAALTDAIVQAFS